jgi:hypothetical protein
MENMTIQGEDVRFIIMILYNNTLVIYQSITYMLCILPLHQWLVLEMSHHANISTAIGKETNKLTNLQPLTHSLPGTSLQKTYTSW